MRVDFGFWRTKRTCGHIRFHAAASAHVATFGERVVDVFYVTDLFGAQIKSATRQAAIKRALLQLLAAADVPAKPARAAAATG